MKQIWKNGIMGVVVGDALGCPVQFETRETVARHPITGMRGHGTFDLPEGSWTDDSSMTLAILDAIREKKEIDYRDVMTRFLKWLNDGEYTPYGHAFDVGIITSRALRSWHGRERGGSGNPCRCGSTAENSNGNGSLMRSLPVSLYCHEKGLTDEQSIEIVHNIGSMTHGHIRSNIACGLYHFMVMELLDGEGTLAERLQKGLDRGFAYYEAHLADCENLEFYDRLRDLKAFARVHEDMIGSGGYVVDTLEAAVWSLLVSDSFENALLTAVNLGHDTDTVGAICGGLAGLFYGYDAIPEAWLAVIKRRKWIEEMCDGVEL